jgi:hypothetical protein
MPRKSRHPMHHQNGHRRTYIGQRGALYLLALASECRGPLGYNYAIRRGPTSPEAAAIGRGFARASPSCAPACEGGSVA